MKQGFEFKNLIIILTLPMLMACFITGIGFTASYAYILYMATVAVDICISKKIEFPKMAAPLFLTLLFFWFLLPLALFHIDSLNGFVYVFVLLLFTYTANLIGRETVNSNMNFIRLWAIIAFAICMLQVARNFSEINMDTIFGVLYDANSGEARIRAYFGFLHPNSTAYIFLTTMLLQYIAFIESKSKRKKIYLVAIAICIVPFLCTGSRTAALALISFVLFEVFLYVIKRAERGRVLIVIAAVMLLFVIILRMDFSDLDTESSGRTSRIIDSLNVMYHDNTLFFGAVVRNISGARDALKSRNLLGTDNSYFSIILRFGVLGLVAFLSAAIGFVKKLYDESIKYGVKTYSISLFVMLLIYGMGENVLFNQSSSICFLVWAMLFRQIYVIEAAKFRKLGSQELK